MLFCGAFTQPVKIEIKERAKERSELSGTNSRPLVCAHLQHRGGRKKRSRYDYSENGLLVTDIEHLAHHLLFKNNPEFIGLATEQNDLSLISLVKNVRDYNEQHQISDEDTHKKLSKALNAWNEFYEFD